MPRVYAVQVDDDTEQRIEDDRVMLGAALGVDLTRSQYLRIIIDQRLQGAAYDPEESGYGEGFKSGYADFSKEFQSFIAQFLRTRTGKTG